LVEEHVKTGLMVFSASLQAQWLWLDDKFLGITGSLARGEE